MIERRWYRRTDSLECFTQVLEKLEFGLFRIIVQYGFAGIIRRYIKTESVNVIHGRILYQSS